MSFSQEQKAEIITQPIKASCCKRAFVQGVLAARGRLDSESIIISVDSVDTAEFLKAIILDVYSKSGPVNFFPNGILFS